MDTSEGQNNTNISFDSQKIGTRPTVDYFSNIDGGRKDDEKIQRHRTRLTRKALTIILAALGAILVVVTIIFLVNIIGGNKPREYTSDDFPQNINDFEEKAYSLVYSDGWSYGEVATFIEYAIADSKDPERTLQLKLMRIEFLRQAGYVEAAEGELIYLLENTYDDPSKYLVYMAAANFYYNIGDVGLAETYQLIADRLDVPQNQGDWLDDDTADAPFDPETDKYTWDQSNPDPDAENAGEEVNE